MMRREGSHASVLVVEDDEDIRTLTMELLLGAGYNPIAACNGQEALDKLASATQVPVLILLDVMMPVMDGRSFRAHQLRIAAFAPIPVIITSAYSPLEQLARELDAAAFVQKPADINVLLDLVRMHQTHRPDSVPPADAGAEQRASAGTAKTCG